MKGIVFVFCFLPSSVNAQCDSCNRPTDYGVERNEIDIRPRALNLENELRLLRDNQESFLIQLGELTVGITAALIEIGVEPPINATVSSGDQSK